MTTNKMDNVRFAVVGLGNIGSRHLAVLDAHPQAQIRAICDLESEKCEKYSVMYDNVPYFTNFGELLLRTDVDVVNICTPHILHAPMAIGAARAGKHILVEKPMALTVNDAEAMITAAQRNKVRLMVVKQNRYNIPVILTKKALDADKLGRIFMVQCNVLWNRHLDYYQESTWRGRKALEGGMLYTQVSHFLDLMIWWFGDIVSAQAQTATKYHAIEIEDCGTALIRFDSGVMGSLSWTACAYRKNYEGSITIVGENGTIKIGGQYLNRIEYWDVKDYSLPSDLQFVDRPNSYGKYQGTSSNHDKVINDVIGDLLHDQRNIVDGGEGLKTVRAIEKIYRHTNIWKE